MDTPERQKSFKEKVCERACSELEKLAAWDGTVHTEILRGGEGMRGVKVRRNWWTGICLQMDFARSQGLFDGDEVLKADLGAFLDKYTGVQERGEQWGEGPEQRTTEGMIAEADAMVERALAVLRSQM